MTGRRWRAITIGVSEFGEDKEDLEFVDERLPPVAEALRALGYEVEHVTATTMTSNAVGKRVRHEIDAMTAEDVLIVHVISHGDVRGGALYLLGSDIAIDSESDVSQWLRTVQYDRDRPLTLFLLDLCEAGTAARIPWLTTLGAGDTRGWVIAACEANEAAFDGRFSTAVANVLSDLDSLDIELTSAHVPLSTVARAIRQEVSRLGGDGYYRQTVTASLLDISADAPELPFFVRRRGTDEHARLRADLDSGLQPFLDDLDEGLDARHFIDRASGVRDLTDKIVGCFSGRRIELQKLTHWVNTPSTGELCVVTGKAGVGKSALLGILVCASHPVLRAQTRPMWQDVDQAPQRVIYPLAAVHVRNRSAQAIARSIASQFDLDPGLTGADLARVIKESFPKPPIVVLDALDEADEPAAVLSELVLPLAGAARLIVGVRPYEEFQQLLDSAEVVDLDAVKADVLEEDLFTYINKLLRIMPSYKRGGVAGAFAGEVAPRLAHEPSEWGPFLVAGLYTRYVVTQHPEAGLLGVEKATDLGRTMPRTLPEILELDLGSRSSLLLRKVLTALAGAHGQGMPISVLTRIAGVSAADARVALLDAKHYLRQSTDVDRTTVYRLFHHGLNEQLATGAPVLDALLAPLGPVSERDWSAAEPYVVRHVLAEATRRGRLREIVEDPGFLALPQAAELLAGCAEVDERLVWLAQNMPDEAALPVAALRAGLCSLAERAAGRETWRPRWICGGLTPEEATDYSASRSRWFSSGEHPCGIAISGDGWKVVSVHEDGHVRVWDLVEDEVREVLETATPPTSVAVDQTGASFLVGGAWGTTLVSDDVVIDGLSLPPGASGVQEVTIAPSGQGFVAVTEDGSIITSRTSPADDSQKWTSGHWRSRWTLAYSDQPVMVSTSGNKIWYLDRIPTDHAEIDFVSVDNLIVSTAVSSDGLTVACLDRESGVSVFHDRKLLWHKVFPSSTALAISGNGQYLAVAGNYLVRLLDVRSSAVVATEPTYQSEINRVSVNVEGSVVAYAGPDGQLFVWWPSGSLLIDLAPPVITAFAPTSSILTHFRHVMVGTSTGLITQAETETVEHFGRLLIADSRGVVRLADSDSGTYEQQVFSGYGTAESMSRPLELPDRVQVFWDDGKRMVWNPRPGRLDELNPLVVLSDREQTRIAARTIVLGDGLAQFQGHDSGDIVLHRLEKHTTPSVIGTHPTAITEVVCGRAHGRAFVAAFGEAQVSVWPLDDGGGRSQLIVFSAEVTSLDFGHDRLYVCVGGELYAFDHHEEML